MEDCSSLGRRTSKGSPKIGCPDESGRKTTPVESKRRSLREGPPRLEEGGARETAERRSAGRDRPGVVVPVREARSAMPKGYGLLLAEFKGRIGQARLRIALAANSGMILLYWELGRLILERQSREGWGSKVVDRLSSDLRTAFPEMKGLSPRNLKYMRAFAEAWPDGEIVQRTIAQLPWRQNLALLDKLDSPSERLWYAERCYVVIDLKAGAFEPGHMGQIGFYQAVVDDVLRQPEDQPTIGLLLVREKSRVLAEYCLSGNKRPVGIAEWTNRLTRILPEKFQGSLPTIEEIEVELSRGDDEPTGTAKAGRSNRRGGK